MDVEIDDGDPLQTVRFQRVRGGHGDVVEEAEPHGLITGGVVPGRTGGDEGIGRFAAHHQVDRQHRAAGRMACGFQAIRVHAGVGVEHVHACAGHGGFDGIDIGGVMHSQQLAAVHARGLVMRQEVEQAGSVQPVVDGSQAGRTFRVPVAHVVLQA